MTSAMIAAISMVLMTMIRMTIDMRAALPAAGFFLCLAAVLFMTAADDSAQRAAEAQMKARLFTKYPDPAIAAMLPPAQNKD